MKILLSLLVAFVPAMARADTDVQSVTVTTSTSIYASGDQIGSVLSLTEAVTRSGGGRITSVSLVDKAKQKSPLAIHFFRSSPTVASVDNGALDITDAEMAAKWIGAVTFEAGDYIDLSNSSVAQYGNGAADKAGYLDMVVEGGNGNLYAVVEALGTPTYTSTSDLILNVGIVRE